jgi:hypothetical protein
MTSTRPTFVAVFIAAYWDLNRVLRELRRPALIAFGILVGVQIGALIAPRLLSQSMLGRMVFRHAIELGGLVLLAPFMIAVHRYILLGERTRRYSIEPASQHFQLFAGWLVVLGLLASIPSYLVVATTPAGPIYHFGRPPSPDPAQIVMLFAVLSTVFVLLTRMIILLPAVAIDAPGATWQNAFADTRRNTWYVVLASFLPAIPLLLLFAAALFFVRLTVPWWPAALLVGYLMLMAMYFILLALTAVVVSRLYQALGDRLNQPLP